MKFLLTIVALVCPYLSLSAQLQINEFMQSNIDCIMDDRNEFPDSWVELYNPTTTAINLQDYKIGISSDRNEAYQLPNNTILPKSFAIIYCDKEEDGMHTSFRLESGKGGAIYLFNNKEIVAKLENIDKQPAPNISYGRKTEGSDEWGYMLTSTPGKRNNSALSLGILPEISFSIPGQVIDDNKSIIVSLQTEEDAPEGTEIRYTTDGSEPTRSSALYSTAFHISNTKVIRAKAFCNGYLSPRSTTQSYIFHPREMTLPVISIVSDDHYFNDDKIGILVKGTYSDTENYKYNWRRPINLEYFTEPSAESNLNQLCEARVQGNASRGCQIKSLALYANKRFGKKRFKYEFFPDQRPSQTKYKSIILRNAGNDFDYLYMRDAIIQRSMAENVDLDWQAWQPSIFYLNGKYIGMLNIRERANEDNVFSNYDELEDIDMFENWWDKKAGTWDNMNAFKAFFAEHGHTWAEYSERMDLVEYINLMIMNLYFNNQDFPGNNIVLWRPRTEDGKWRFIAKDTDFGLGLYNHPSDYNTIAWLYNPSYDADRAWANTSDATRLFRRLMEDPDFSREFIDRAAIYMGDFLNFEGVWHIWSPMHDAIKAEYPSHRKLINQWWPNYDNELSAAMSWLKARTGYFYTYLKEYYGLGNLESISVVVGNKRFLSDDFHITINGVPLTDNSLSGQFFEGRALTLSSTASDKINVTGWRIMTISDDGKTETHEFEGDTYSLFMPHCKSLVIFPQITTSAETPNDIPNITQNSNSNPSTIYDLQGLRHNSMKNGINIVRDNDGNTHKILFHK